MRLISTITSLTCLVAFVALATGAAAQDATMPVNLTTNGTLDANATAVPLAAASVPPLVPAPSVMRNNPAVTAAEALGIRFPEPLADPFAPGYMETPSGTPAAAPVMPVAAPAVPLAAPTPTLAPAAPETPAAPPVLATSPVPAAAPAPAMAPVAPPPGDARAAAAALGILFPAPLADPFAPGYAETPTAPAAAVVGAPGNTTNATNATAPTLAAAAPLAMPGDARGAAAAVGIAFPAPLADPFAPGYAETPAQVAPEAAPAVTDAALPDEPPTPDGNTTVEEAPEVESFADRAAAFREMAQAARGVASS